MTHTTGPWRVMQATSQEPGAMQIIYGGNLERVAIIPDVEFAEHREAIADARLIAAAPDLLDALRQLAWLEPGDQLGSGDVAAIRAAIAKATGEQLSNL